MPEGHRNIWERMCTLVHTPHEARPWMEFRCDQDVSLFLGKFIDDFDNIPLLDENDHGFIFRGQSNSEWTLKPRLVRVWDEMYGRCRNKTRVVQEALLKEYDAIQYFQKRVGSAEASFRSLSRALSLDTYAEWLAAMQHYSAPTRLLDWTSSFYVALYFAVEEPRVDGAVWILNAQTVREYTDKVISEKGYGVEQANAVFASCESYVEFGVGLAPIVEVVSNQFKTDRMIAQHSLFTLSYQLFFDHAYVGLPMLDRLPPVLIKIVIPSESKRIIRQRLSKINLFADVLFPGLDGIGRAVNERVVIFLDAFGRSLE